MSEKRYIQLRSKRVTGGEIETRSRKMTQPEVGRRTGLGRNSRESMKKPEQPGWRNPGRGCLVARLELFMEASNIAQQIRTP